MRQKKKRASNAGDNLSNNDVSDYTYYSELKSEASKNQDLAVKGKTDMSPEQEKLMIDINISANLNDDKIKLRNKSEKVQSLHGVSGSISARNTTETAKDLQFQQDNAIPSKEHKTDSPASDFATFGPRSAGKNDLKEDAAEGQIKVESDDGFQETKATSDREKKEEEEVKGDNSPASDEQKPGIAKNVATGLLDRLHNGQPKSDGQGNEEILEMPQKRDQSPVSPFIDQKLAVSNAQTLPKKYQPLYTVGIAGEGLASASLFAYLSQKPV